MLSIPSSCVGCKFLLVILVKDCNSEMNMAWRVCLGSWQGWLYSVVGEGIRSSVIELVSPWMTIYPVIMCRAPVTIHSGLCFVSVCVICKLCYFDKKFPHCPLCQCLRNVPGLFAQEWAEPCFWLCWRDEPGCTFLVFLSLCRPIVWSSPVRRHIVRILRVRGPFWGCLGGWATPREAFMGQPRLSFLAFQPWCVILIQLAQDPQPWGDTSLLPWGFLKLKTCWLFVLSPSCSWIEERDKLWSSHSRLCRTHWRPGQLKLLPTHTGFTFLLDLWLKAVVLMVFGFFFKEQLYFEP